METRSNVWMHFGKVGVNDLTFVKGEGVWLYDHTGRKVLDALSGLLCVQVGYGRESIAEAMSKQAKQLSFCSLFNNSNPIVEKLTNKLLQLSPNGYSAVFLTTGGSTAIETALKIAQQYQRLKGNQERKYFASRLYSYHGSGFGASMISGMSLIRNLVLDQKPISRFFPPPNPYRCRYCEKRCTNECLNMFESRMLRDTAAIIVEPVQNGGGAIPSTKEYMQTLQMLCNEKDVLLISDETICSFGRIGTWFGCQRLNYTPDIIVVGKGITSGYAPLGAVIVANKVCEVFEKNDIKFPHGFTYGGHVISCAAALSNIEIIENEKLMDHVNNVIEPRLRAFFASLSEHPLVGNIRGTGAFWAIELTADKSKKESLRHEKYRGMLQNLSDRLYENGIFCRTDDREEPTITLAPQLIFSQENIDFLCRQIEKSLNETLRNDFHGKGH